METKFNADEFSFAYPDGIENNYWNVARNKIILNCINQHNINNILDVGCGRGIVTDYLFKRGVSIQGVELGNTAPMSNAKVSVLFNTNALNLSEEFSNPIDTISLFDVIEHIEEPKIFIQNLIAHFKNVKYLVITVPARQELWSNFDEYYGHFKRYDLYSVRNEMNEVGFEIIENNYFFNALYLGIRLSNLFSKKREIQFNVPTGYKKTIHAALGQLFYLEKFVIPKVFFGSSIICIARKKGQ